MEYVKWEPLSEAEVGFVNDTMAKVQAVALKHLPNVTKWYNDKE